MEFYTDNAVWIEPLIATGALALGIWLFHLKPREKKNRETWMKVMVASGCFSKNSFHK